MINAIQYLSYAMVVTFIGAGNQTTDPRTLLRN
jgi:hypothetical protein